MVVCCQTRQPDYCDGRSERLRLKTHFIHSDGSEPDPSPHFSGENEIRT